MGRDGRSYRHGLGLAAVGDPDSHGLPEPLQFALLGGTRLMLVPTGGFGRAIGHSRSPAAGTASALDLQVPTDADVDEVVGRARRAGAEPVSEPGRQPWVVRRPRSPTPTGTSGP